MKWRLTRPAIGALTASRSSRPLAQIPSIRQPSRKPALSFHPTRSCRSALIGPPGRLEPACARPPRPSSPPDSTAHVPVWVLQGYRGRGFTFRPTRPVPRPKLPGQEQMEHFDQHQVPPECLGHGERHLLNLPVLRRARATVLALERQTCALIPSGTPRPHLGQARQQGAGCDTSPGALWQGHPHHPSGEVSAHGVSVPFVIPFLRQSTPIHPRLNTAGAGCLIDRRGRSDARHNTPHAEEVHSCLRKSAPSSRRLCRSTKTADRCLGGGATSPAP